mmetsp:Transcript_45977/g.68424  ORF Transcript_45977/g.68424 Transcript_45977/m.68424 type:complete len:95 (+) Transcript_45977:547-831(+)
MVPSIAHTFPRQHEKKSIDVFMWLFLELFATGNLPLDRRSPCWTLKRWSSLRLPKKKKRRLSPRLGEQVFTENLCDASIMRACCYCRTGDSRRS